VERAPRCCARAMYCDRHGVTFAVCFGSTSLRLGCCMGRLDPN
jgi:hypothetical protein